SAGDARGSRATQHQAVHSRTGDRTRPVSRRSALRRSAVRTGGNPAVAGPAARPGTTDPGRGADTMRGNFVAAAWRLGIFLAVCALGTFVLLSVFAQFRFGEGKTFNAEFTNVSGLKDGDLVRIAGVEVGKVQSITVGSDAIVTVSF